MVDYGELVFDMWAADVLSLKFIGDVLDTWDLAKVISHRRVLAETPYEELSATDRRRFELKGLEFEQLAAEQNNKSFQYLKDALVEANEQLHYSRMNSWILGFGCICLAIMAIVSAIQ